MLDTNPYVIRIDVNEVTTRWMVEVAASPEMALERAVKLTNEANLRKGLKFRVYCVCQQLVEADVVYEYPHARWPNMGEVLVNYVNHG